MARPNYSDTVSGIYEAAVMPDRWAAVLGKVSEHVGALGGMLVFNDLVANTGGIVTGGGLRPDLDETYVKYYVRNPWNVAMASRNLQGIVVSTTLLEDNSSIYHSAFGADILAPQKIRNNICSIHPEFLSANKTGGFGFSLTSGQDEEMDQVVRRLARVIPHLNRALDLGFDIAGSRQGDNRFDRLIDILPNPAMVLDRNGRLVQVNPSAETLLADGDFVRMGADGRMRLAPPWRASEARMGSLIERAIAPVDDGAEKMRLGLRIHRGPDVPPLLLLLTPLAPTPFDFWEMVKPGARLLLQLIDPLVDPRTDAGLLRQVFGFTPTETTVARLIARGLSAPQIARATGSRPSTVRTHIARLFEKTGVHSQVALARLLSAMADGRARSAPGD